MPISKQICKQQSHIKDKLLNTEKPTKRSTAAQQMFKAMADQKLLPALQETKTETALSILCMHELAGAFAITAEYIFPKNELSDSGNLSE